MKLAFLLLLLANLLVLAWNQGVFGDPPETGREPQRVARQIEPERIRVLEPREVTTLRERAKEQKARDNAARAAVATAAPAADVPAAVPAAACIEFGDFIGEQAARARKRLDALNLGDRLAEQAVEANWYLVYVPPLRTRAAADTRAEELRRAGLKDVQVIADNSPLRLGVSLGFFRDQDLANKLLEDLTRRGTKDARIVERPSTAGAVRFKIRNVDDALARQLGAVQKEFAPAKMQQCPGTFDR
jgi:hypothetical protein